jgi:hypothetical protein
VGLAVRGRTRGGSKPTSGSGCGGGRRLGWLAVWDACSKWAQLRGQAPGLVIRVNRAAAGLWGEVLGSLGRWCRSGSPCAPLLAAVGRRHGRRWHHVLGPRATQEAIVVWCLRDIFVRLAAAPLRRCWRRHICTTCTEGRVGALAGGGRVAEELLWGTC